MPSTPIGLQLPGITMPDIMLIWAILAISVMGHGLYKEEHKKHKIPVYKNFIGGEWVPSSSGEIQEIVNPATEQVIAHVQKSNQQDVEAAINAARDAFDSGVWSEMTPGERTAIIWKLADLIEKNADFLAHLESIDVGKTYKYARESDLPFIIDNLKFFAGAARVLEGKSAGEYADFHHAKQHKGLGMSFVRREPIGVVGAIVPWNYPLYIATWKLAPALAAGNTVVIKPASQTPLTTLEFCKLLHDAGLPPGVLNVVTGPGDIVGDAISKSTKVDMVAMTGDTATGKKIMQNASTNLKRAHLELGGKAPLIALPDADLEAVAESAVVGGFWNSGQDCTAVTRVYVHEAHHDKLVKMMVEKAAQFTIGDPLHRGTDMGPLINEKQRERVESYVREGVKQGAKIVFGGQRPKNMKKGFYFQPTILTNVRQHDKVCQEEIFGPVVSVLKYNTVKEAVDKANDVAYGLAASVFGCNITQSLNVAKQLNFGTVWINEHGILVSEMPHGGFKQSGFGKDLSMYSFEEYTRVKHVYIDLTGAKRKPWYYVVYGKK